MSAGERARRRGESRDPASVSSVGFRPVGVYRRIGYKLGAWHDVVVWWHLLLRERVADPDPPRSVSSYTLPVRVYR
jgi:hypothetical protein